MILFFAGTGNGRKLAHQLADQGQHLVICTATIHGQRLLGENKNFYQIYHEPMNADRMEELIIRYRPEKVIDATHPFAQEVSKNIAEACHRQHIAWETIDRASFLDEDLPDGVKVFDNYQELVLYLQDIPGKVLLTIGSNNLHFFAHLGSRILARVLPTSDILKKCEDLGLAANQIIAVQGPFSADFNLAVYRDHQIDILVTKDSGPEGGVGEKVYPALAAGLQVLMIRRPVPEKNS